MKHFQKTTALLVALVCVACFTVPALAAPTVSVTLPFSVSLTGKKPSTIPVFPFALVATSTNAPMPATTTVLITGSGSSSFGPIQYSQPGDYTYQLFQLYGNRAGYTYDRTVYDVTVQVTSDNSGNLSASFYFANPVSGSKPSVAGFVNSYKKKTDIPKTGYDGHCGD